MVASNSSKTTTNQPGDSPIFESMTGMPTEMPASPITEKPKRSRRAEQYESQVQNVLKTLMRSAAENSATVPDAAAIIVHGPPFA